MCKFPLLGFCKKNSYYREVTKRKDCSDWIHVQGSSFGIANFAREEPATLQCLFLALTTVQLVNIFWNLIYDYIFTYFGISISIHWNFPPDRYMLPLNRSHITQNCSKHLSLSPCVGVVEQANCFFLLPFCQFMRSDAGSAPTSQLDQHTGGNWSAISLRNRQDIS